MASAMMSATTSATTTSATTSATMSATTTSAMMSATTSAMVSDCGGLHLSASVEMASYANLGVLSTIKLKFEDTRIVGIASHISGAFTVILLAVIISYHLYAIVRTKYSNKRHTNEQQLNETATANYSTARGSTSTDIGKPTFSALYLGPPDSIRQNSARVEISTNYDEDDRASLASVDSTSPLLDYHH